MPSFIMYVKMYRAVERGVMKFFKQRLSHSKVGVIFTFNGQFFLSYGLFTKAGRRSAFYDVEGMGTNVVDQEQQFVMVRKL